MWNPGLESPRNDCFRRVQATHYLRGELSPSELAAFERHLPDCTDCTQELASLRATIASLESSAAATEFHGLKDRLADRVLDRVLAASRSEGKRRFRVYARAGLALAAASLVIALAALSIHGITNRVPGGVVGRPDSSHPNPARSTPDHPASSTADSVNLARQWLLASQEPDGSWRPSKWGGDPRFRIALTSLALLSLDGAASGPSRDARRRGLRFVASQPQDDTGLIGPRFRGSIYNHAVATLAWLRFDHARETADHETRLDRALEFLVDTQREHGAWGYLPVSENSANEVVSLWSLQALCRARAAGHPGLDDSIRRASGWFHARLGEDSGHGQLYLGRGGHICGRSHPASSLWALLSASQDLSDRLLRRCVDRLSAEGAGANSDYYESYLITRAVSGADLPGTATLRERLRESILASQVRSGAQRGSWEPSDRWSAVGGRIYSTTLATMSLARAD